MAFAWRHTKIFPASPKLVFFRNIEKKSGNPTEKRHADKQALLLGFSS